MSKDIELPDEKHNMKIWNTDFCYQMQLMLGEGPLWHPDREKILYVDIEGKKIGSLDPVTGRLAEKTVPEKVSRVLPATNGKLIAAMRGSIAVLDFGTEELGELVKIEEHKPNNRCNDGRCDAAGRLWIGTMHVDAKEKEGALYCYEGWSLRKKIEHVNVSNGLCWSVDNKTMYYVDSFDYNIKAYDFDLESGDISAERILLEITEPGHIPDGICLDEEGMIWVAIWGGACVLRFDPVTRKVIGKVVVNAPNVTSCAFGGAARDQLFITTARIGLDRETLERYPLSGSIFYANVGVSGLVENCFNLNI